MRGVVWPLFAMMGLAIVAVTPSQSHAANLTPLVSFNSADGSNPRGKLIADAHSKLKPTLDRRMR